MRFSLSHTHSTQPQFHLLTYITVIYFTQSHTFPLTEDISLSSKDARAPSGALITVAIKKKKKKKRGMKQEAWRVKPQQVHNKWRFLKMYLFISQEIHRSAHHAPGGEETQLDIICVKHRNNLYFKWTIFKGDVCLLRHEGTSPRSPLSHVLSRCLWHEASVPVRRVECVWSSAARRGGAREHVNVMRSFDLGLQRPLS